jgi:hypothetical protein
MSPYKTSTISIAPSPATSLALNFIIGCPVNGSVEILLGR